MMVEDVMARMRKRRIEILCLFVYWMTSVCQRVISLIPAFHIVYSSLFFNIIHLVCILNYHLEIMDYTLQVVYQIDLLTRWSYVLTSHKK